MIGTATGKPAFSFKQGDERSNTGSHYTPDELVQPLIKHSLDHLIAERLREPQRFVTGAAPTSSAAPVASTQRVDLPKLQERALLSLRVADISCGSGHILLAAARRIATELAIVRTGMEQPRAADFRVAMRDVIRHCIYGVDLNPLAVELCKVALWLEAHIPGEPLNFLDHRIKCGNAIVGFARREELDRGVPEEAFATLPGDDKDVAAAFRKRNKQERQTQGQTSLELSADVEAEVNKVVAAYKLFEGMPERTPAEIEAKQRRFQEAMQADAYRLNQVAAIPIAQFYIPKTSATKDQLITDATYRSYWTKGRQLLGPAPAMAWATAERKRFFHWFLEFPEVMAAGGFDCVIGNPPFMGNRKLSGRFGDSFLHYLLYEYAPISAVDLVTYFFRRIYTLLSPGGFLSLISTNTIAQGNARIDGLEFIVKNGGTINHAVRSLKWPGRAAVEISLVSIHKGEWSRERHLNQQPVDSITPYLDNEGEGQQPTPLIANAEMAFQGSIVLGMGFVMEADKAAALIKKDRKNRDVLFPYLNGENINNLPDQEAKRWVINFFDWPLERASTVQWKSADEDARTALIKAGIVSPDYDQPVARDYPDCLSILEASVQSERSKKGEEVGKGLWWQHWRSRKRLYQLIAAQPQVIVIASTSKTTAFALVPSNAVFTANLTVTRLSDYSTFAVLQSRLHIEWIWKYSTKLKTDPIYGPETCFETFPFPEDQWQTPNASLAALGERYHEHRKQLMRHSWRGLTDVYNLFHSPLLRTATPEELALPDKDFEKLLGKDTRLLRKHLLEPKTPADVEVWPFNRVVEGVLRLRQLHVELDNAVRDAYGWLDLDLQHAFYDVDTLPENDRTRYTISPAARKEVLKRLLALNHERAAEEAKAGVVKKGKKSKGGEDNVVGEPAGEYRTGLFQEGGLFGGGVGDAIEAEEDASSEPKRGRGRPPKVPNGQEDLAAQAVLLYLQTHAGWHGKSAVLSAIGIDDGLWNAAIKSLLEEGKVEKEGEKKGARYRVAKSF
ncbi:MAG: hypothetical protein IPM46_09845 [Flavobacteriales bacterium]|nr:hypothetical protein [Flavobacteriales bacterium]